MAPGGGEVYSFALATSLSSICHTLDIESIADPGASEAAPPPAALAKRRSTPELY